jgi:peptidoglycan/LPS O-acetylase OafA/YrhL
MQEPSGYRYFGSFRLLLAFLVLIQHFLANVAPEALASLFMRFEMGSVAVLVFFSLSGFVIFEAVDQIYQDRPASFFANRLLRIVPHYFVAVTAAILLYYFFDATKTLRIARDGAWTGESAFAIKNILVNYLGFMTYTNNFMTYEFIGIAWAIRIEMAFYIVVAAAIFLVRSHTSLSSQQPHLDRIGLLFAVLLSPLYILSVLGKLPRMFQFEPYFVFGCALYVVVARRNQVAVVVICVSLLAIAWQFLAQPPLHPRLSFERSVAAQFALLLSLLSLMIVLALARVRSVRLRRVDRFLGDLTYPLYVSHPNVMVIFLSTTVGYSYPILCVSLIAALVVAWISSLIVDPSVRKIRDTVRGGPLNQLWGIRQYPVKTETGLSR